MNVGLPPRNINSPEASGFKQQLLSHLPNDRPITVLAVMGDAEAFQFASQIRQFLMLNGYPLTGTGVSQVVRSNATVAVEIELDTRNIIVGQNPHPG